MPESRSRPKKARSQRYQLEPQRKQHSKGSPRWYGPMLLVVMGLGVLMIVLNYVGVVLPGAPHLAHVETPDLFNAAVRGFLGDIQH